jgi:hypothetical protein
LVGVEEIRMWEERVWRKNLEVERIFERGRIFGLEKKF